MPPYQASLRSFTILSISISVPKQRWIGQETSVLQSVFQASAHIRTVLFHPYSWWQKKHSDDLLTFLTPKYTACSPQLPDMQQLRNGIIINNSSKDAVACNVLKTSHIAELSSSRDQHSRANDYLLLYGVCNDIIWLLDDTCSVTDSAKGCPLAGPWRIVFYGEVMFKMKKV